ncbi:tyrosine-type recombinase/integrase [Methanofollis ethanolicus]|uniref:tyrosine-type recombinase/integrase n=1 Tax=Methanofollis ethanolicus TaxID=488124 RepID=UPI00082EDA87|nr:tyrosine-type recombinase/integrase [Methanofollis ethanolicus]
MEASANYFHEQGEPGYWDQQLKKAEADGRIDSRDAALVRRYINYKQGGRGISHMRSTKISQILVSWKQVLPVPWSEATIDDLFAARVRLTSMKNSRGRPYKQNTISDHIRILKGFYKWLAARGYSTIRTDELAELKPPATDTETTDPGDLMTAEELAAMIKACKTHRDRAIIAVTYETGARIGEVARLKWSDIQFDKYGVRCTINDTKERKKRYPRLINSTAYLAAWRNGYYGPAAEGDAYVFVSTDGEPLKYRAISQVIERAADRANIKKRIHPHLFRKSRITELVKKNYQESVIKETFWANPDTQMFRTYLKLSEKDIDDEFLRKAGLKTESEIDADDDKPKQCMFCLAVNPPGSRFCRMCTKPLTAEAADAVREAEKKIEATPEYESLLAAMKEQVRREMASEATADSAPKSV